MTKPTDVMKPAEQAMYAWLAENGIDEWVPEDVWVRVDIGAGTLTYLSFRWNGERGWEGGDNIWHPSDDGLPDDTPHTVERTVPLVVAPTPQVRQAFADTGIDLEETR